MQSKITRALLVSLLFLLLRCCSICSAATTRRPIGSSSAVIISSSSGIASPSSPESHLLSGEQRFAMEPQDQTAIVGSRVTLPCRVLDKTGQLQWTKDDFGLGTHRNLSGFERYSMIGSDEEGGLLKLISIFVYVNAMYYLIKNVSKLLKN